MHPFDRFSSNGNGHTGNGHTGNGHTGNGHTGNGHTGNGHSDDLLSALGITPPPSPPKPAGESASLRGEEPPPPGETPNVSAQARNEGRDAQGRFTQGNKGGPGNPYNRRVAQLKRAFHSVVTEERMAKVAEQLLTMAEQGDKAAARLVLQYTLDRSVKPDQENIEESAILKQEASIFSDMPGLMTKPEPSLPLMMVREARSHMTGDVGNMMFNLLNCPQERIPEFQSVLQHDPKTARDWLDNGVPSPRKQTRRQRKAKNAKRRKRPG